MDTEIFYITKMKEDLSRRQRDNPNYSLRAYARDLGLHPGTLVQVMSGSRPLPTNAYEKVMTKLKLGAREKTLFMESVMGKKMSLDAIKVNPKDDRYILDESYYKIIAEWEHFIVTDLFDLKDFEPTLEEISRHLNITMERAEVVVDNLLTSGLLARNAKGQLEKVHAKLRTTEDTKNQAILEGHLETLKMGMVKLDEVAVELRDFSSLALAVDLEQIIEAKTIIREFRQKMAALLKGGKNKTDIFQLAIQFYPLTNTKRDEE